LSRIFFKLILIIAGLGIVFQCSDRKRLNPIDPRNPATEGRPKIVKIYSELDRAILQWQSLHLKGLRGYQIYRRKDSEQTFKAVHLAPPDSNQFIDTGLTYNRKYYYFLTVVAEDFETPGSDTVTVIPGPTITWATDVYNRRLLKISHDGMHEIRQIAVDGYPWEVIYDDENNALWYTDVFLNRVYRIKSQTFRIILELPFGEPIDMVFDKNHNRIWVLDETRGKIFVFNRQGEKVGEKSGFAKPVAIDCFRKDGSCRVVDTKRATVTRISTTMQTNKEISQLIHPTSVSINQLTGEFWVADSSRILKFDIRGKQQLSIARPAKFLKYLTVDSELDRCWVLDVSIFARQSRLLCFNSEGDKLLELKGLSYPENLTINPYDHSCIVADSGAGRILKVSLQGTIIGQVTGYDYTHGLFVEVAGER